MGVAGINVRGEVIAYGDWRSSAEHFVLSQEDRCSSGDRSPVAVKSITASGVRTQ